MKKFNMLLAVVALLTVATFQAQNTTNKWYIGVGAHAEDFTSVRGLFDGYFDFDDYSIVPPLSKLTVARNLNRLFAVDFEGSFGNVDDKRLGLKDEFYALVGLGIRFMPLQKSWVDFYLRGGANYLRYSFEDAPFPNYAYPPSDGEWSGLEQPVDPQNNNFAVTAGAGLNFWFTKNFGLNVESNYVWVPASGLDYFDHFQHSAGLVFRFGNKDQDGDGILDTEDKCPEEAGPAENNGCPWGDTDGDGVLDNVDSCPEVPGLASCNGCPDTDGDGVCDNKDNCVNEAGPADNNGCPYKDSDGDGVLDKDDACPTVPGVKSTDKAKNGCPPKLNPVEVAEQATLALENLLFDTNKSNIRADQQYKIDKAVAVLKDADGSYYIDGHTDSRGAAAYNLKLSKERAESVVKALEAKGVEAGKLTPRGFGETELKCKDESTPDGLQCNRRVVLSIKN